MRTDLTNFATRYAAAWSSQSPDSLAVEREAISATAQSHMAALPDMLVVPDRGSTTTRSTSARRNQIRPCESGLGIACRLHMSVKWRWNCGIKEDESRCASH